MSSINHAQVTSIRDRAQVHDYVEQAVAAILQLESAANPPDLLVRLIHATEVMGASASVYTASIPEIEGETTSFNLFACHPSFAQAQSNRDTMLDNPWFRFARTHTSAGTNRQMPHLHATDDETLAIATQFGFRSCLVIPTVTGADPARLEMLCLGSAWEDDFEGPQARVVRTLARSLAHELNDWLTHYLQHYLCQEARLDDCDVRLLAMEWQGLSSKEIARKTGLSLSSVNCRFQRINTRLKCASRRASARRAAAYGVLELI